MPDCLLSLELRLALCRLSDLAAFLSARGLETALSLPDLLSFPADVDLVLVPVEVDFLSFPVETWPLLLSVETGLLSASVDTDLLSVPDVDLVLVPVEVDFLVSVDRMLMPIVLVHQSETPETERREVDLSPEL